MTTSEGGRHHKTVRQAWQCPMLSERHTEAKRRTSTRLQSAVSPSLTQPHTASHSLTQPNRVDNDTRLTLLKY